MLLGFETSDDAAVYALTPEIAAVLTVDFFTPMVDDPYEFGRIAGANALSDVFAMGAKPLIALNLLALDSALGTEIAKDILQGGADAVAEAGAHIAGGHTIDDDEPKYGLSVFGTVDPDQIIRNQGATPGDILYLTKPLGMGIMTSALKVGKEDEKSIRPVIESMMELNMKASQAMIEAEAHAATDVTGFGLAGHLNEMMKSSSCAAVIDWNALPLFEGVWEYSAQYCRPNRTFSIMDHAAGFVEQGELDDDTFDTRMGIICDPQTSGGLLVAIAPNKQKIFEEAHKRLCGKPAAKIGEAITGKPGDISFA